MTQILGRMTMSRKSVGYKQLKEHFNAFPEADFTIDTLSAIGTCRYDPEAKKTASMQDFMKRPVKYYFNVLEKVPQRATSFQHSYFFDKKEDAEKCHKQLRIKLYDQLTKKYLDKMDSNKRLTVYDQAELLKIIDQVSALRP